MRSARTVLKDLKQLDAYLGQFGKGQEAAPFEKLVAEAFSSILHLPVYSADDSPGNNCRVEWKGSRSSLSKAPSGSSDVVAQCYGFHVLIEATLKTGANQWAQEFAAGIRHQREFCRRVHLDSKNVLLVMVCKELHQDTWRSIRSQVGPECTCIPIRVRELQGMLNTSILAFTLRHSEVSRLLHAIKHKIHSWDSLDRFEAGLNDSVNEWSKSVLDSEKYAFVGVKSYEQMVKIDSTHIGTSEILAKLQKHPTVKAYFAQLPRKIDSGLIEHSLTVHGLATTLVLTREGEPLLEPAHTTDFKASNQRLVDHITRNQ